jgi:hypothetical protein
MRWLVAGNALEVLVDWFRDLFIPVYIYIYIYTYMTRKRGGLNNAYSLGLSSLVLYCKLASSCLQLEDCGRRHMLME